MANRGLNSNNQTIEHNNSQTTTSSNKYEQHNDNSRTIDVSGYISRQELTNPVHSHTTQNNQQFNTI